MFANFRTKWIRCVMCIVVLVGASGAIPVHAEVDGDGKAIAVVDEMAALKADNERLKALVPSQSHAMVDVAYHFTNLWFAAQRANWPLAQFYLNETRSHIRWAIRIVPVRHTSAGDLKLEEVFAGFDGTLLGAIQAAVTARNPKEFQMAYRAALGGCNGCHAAAEKPFLRVRVPDQQEVRIIDFNPQRIGK
jgi:hypothetical protein